MSVVTSPRLLGYWADHEGESTNFDWIESGQTYETRSFQPGNEVRFGDKKVSVYLEGLNGCVSILIISNKGFWLSHMIEPAFVHKNTAETNPDSRPSLKAWDEMIRAFTDGTYNADGKDVRPHPKFNRPELLTGDDGILNRRHDVKIFASIPREEGDAPNRPRANPRQVQTLFDFLVGPGKAFEGIPIDVFEYDKVLGQSDKQKDSTLKGNVVVEYAPKGIKEPFSFDPDVPDPPLPTLGPAWRIFREFNNPIEHQIPQEECSPGLLRKRDGACAKPDEPVPAPPPRFRLPVGPGGPKPPSPKPPTPERPSPEPSPMPTLILPGLLPALEKLKGALSTSAPQPQKPAPPPPPPPPPPPSPPPPERPLLQPPLVHPPLLESPQVGPPLLDVVDEPTCPFGRKTKRSTRLRSKRFLLDGLADFADCIGFRLI